MPWLPRPAAKLAWLFPCSRNFVTGAETLPHWNRACYLNQYITTVVSSCCTKSSDSICIPKRRKEACNYSDLSGFLLGGGLGGRIVVIKAYLRWPYKGQCNKTCPKVSVSPLAEWYIPSWCGTPWYLPSRSTERRTLNQAKVKAFLYLEISGLVR